MTKKYKKQQDYNYPIMPPTPKPTPILYTADHHLHEPRYEFENGILSRYQEQPTRIESAYMHLKEMEHIALVKPLEKVPLEILESVHSPHLIKHLQQTSSSIAAQEEAQPNLAPLYRYPYIFPIRPEMRAYLSGSPEPEGSFAFDTYAPIGSGTWQAALASASLAWQGAGMLLEGQRLAYALCRPPGHHAGHDSIGGYCYLNNAAIAAFRLKKMGPGVILDIDYHHGNGTQEILWQDAQVLYVSLHADPTEEYPFYCGFSGETGGDKASNANLNLPLPAGCDDCAYLAALDAALDRIQAFSARWLVLSAGYDTCAADPSTRFQLSDDIFSEIGRRIGGLDLPVLVVHEGGYAMEKNGELAIKLLTGLRSRRTG